MPEVAMSNESTKGPELLFMEMWLWLGISLVLLAGLVVALRRTLQKDGLGHRPPPASRYDWSEQHDQHGQLT